MKNDCLQALLDAGCDKAEEYLKCVAELYEAGDWLCTVEAWAKVIDYDPTNAAAFNNRGFVKSALGDQRGAIADYDEVIRLDPKNMATGRMRRFGGVLFWAGKLPVEEVFYLIQCRRFPAAAAEGFWEGVKVLSEKTIFPLFQLPGIFGEATAAGRLRCAILA